MQTASNSQTLTIQLSPEDGEKLLAEAKRRGVDVASLALMLLHDSLTERNPVADADIESLEKLYTWRGKTKILQFLEKHQFLISVLLEAPTKICCYFPDAQLFLECVTDPEGIDDDLLELAICMNLNPDEAVGKLNQFQDDWWLNLSDKIRQPLVLSWNIPMTFEWSEYLNLARELAGKATTPANQEAKLRAAISRAYYAAFIKARNYLRDTEGLSIPKTGEAHRYVQQQFAVSPDRSRKKIAENLRYLRSYRRKVDYDDAVPG